MSEKKEKEKNRENIMPKKSCQIKKKNKLLMIYLSISAPLKFPYLSCRILSVTKTTFIKIPT